MFYIQSDMFGVDLCSIYSLTYSGANLYFIYNLTCLEPIYVQYAVWHVLERFMFSMQSVMFWSRFLFYMQSDMFWSRFVLHTI